MTKALTSVRSPRLGEVLAIAFPMVVSQASETVMLFVDRLFLARLGKLYLAGAMSGGMTSFNIMSFFLGVVGYVSAVVAQHDGAGQKRPCARATAQAVGTAFLSWPLLLLLIPVVRIFFLKLGHGPEQVELEMTYFRILTIGSLLGLVRTALAGFFLGLGRTRVVMVANVAGMLVNLPANYVLIFGKLGAPAMGIAGAAWGTNLGSLVIVLILLGVYFSKEFRETYGTAREIRFDKKIAKTLISYGTPAGVEIFLNVAAFNLFIQLMHSYGPNVAAAVTIALNYDMVAFVPMLGLGFATTTLVGRFVGARDFSGAERAAWLTMRVAWSYALIMMLFFLVGTRPLVSLFTRLIPGGDLDIAPMAEVMLRLAAFYTLMDATQLIVAGALRGAGDTRFVMWLSVGLHWIFAGITFYLIKVVVVSPMAMWGVLIAFIFIMGVGMILRFRGNAWKTKSFVGPENKEPQVPLNPTDVPL